MFPGITVILETWFVNYKGRNRTRSGGYADVDTAQQMIEWAVEGFEKYALAPSPVLK